MWNHGMGMLDIRGMGLFPFILLIVGYTTIKHNFSPWVLKSHSIKHP